MSIATWEFESPPLHFFAEIAQLVEHNLAKVGVASSSLVFRSDSFYSLMVVEYPRCSTIFLYYESTDFLCV